MSGTNIVCLKRRTIKLPFEIINILQFYTGENEALLRVFPWIEPWVHDFISYDCVKDPKFVLKLEICNSDVSLKPFVNLKVLNCYYNQLKRLPELPDSLEELNCEENSLEEIPKLPLNLKYLYCSRNNLVNLPELPENLERVYCADNYITELPEFPRNVKKKYTKSHNFNRRVF